jgi:CRISPR-associated protein Csx10
MGDGMNALLIDILLCAPVLLSGAQSGDANTAETRQYIPGSAVRGMLISRYLAGQSVTLQLGEPFHTLFFSGKLRFLNAYPACSKDRPANKRALPAPMSLKEDKRSSNKQEKRSSNEQENPSITVYDLAVDDTPSAELAKKPLKGFLTADLRERVTVQTQMQVHIDRGDRLSTTSGQNAVFVYQSLAAGQNFQAVVLGDAAGLAQLQRGLRGESFDALLGKSAQAGYGRVQVTTKVEPVWAEYTPCEAADESEYIFVTALSAWLLRDPQTGAFCGDPSAILGAQHLPERSFIRTEVVGGFNRAWGLPMPQHMAIQPGSVFAYTYDSALLERLQALVAAGIGERRTEGFGRIAVNWNTNKKIDSITKYKETTQTSSPILTNEADIAQAKRIIERLWRQNLEQRLTQAIQAIIQAINDAELKNIPEKAQLSRLRQVVLNALAKNDSALVTTFLQDLKANARQKYERCRIRETRLTAWVDDIVSKDIAEIWYNALKPTTIGGVTLDPEQQKRIRTEFKLRYLAGVVHRMYKTKSQKTGDSHDNN